jgi:hypothetical protein
MASPAFRYGGRIVITFDEGSDSAACCGETSSLSPAHPNGLLRTIEDVFGLPHLGDAAMSQVRSFGTDVFG